MNGARPFPQIKRGIGYWMERVVAERDRALNSFDADAVHDLRTALRRCRSIAEGFQTLDGTPRWRRMRNAGKKIFAALGELRDIQVLLQWIDRFHVVCPAVAERLRAHCLQRESTLKDIAGQVVSDLDAKQWLGWSGDLAERTEALAVPKQVFELLALERFESAHLLHSRALRNRNKSALHQLRIGVKRFRYIVENFLPENHKNWGEDLKQIQDALGDIHDLDVLADLARQTHVCVTPKEKRKFMSAVSKERDQRLQSYRERMVGAGSLWREWRSSLPAGGTLQAAILKRFEVWAQTLVPNVEHAFKVAQFSLRIYDALSDVGLLRMNGGDTVSRRSLLYVAAIAHEVGSRNDASSYRKVSRRLLLKLEIPPSWTQKDMDIVGLVVRFHRGALPENQKGYLSLSREEKSCVDSLSGILRLAESLSGDGDEPIYAIKVVCTPELIEVIADGYRPRSQSAKRIAAARHLLEIVCNVPVKVHQ